MAFTDTDLTNLEAAIAKGVLRVREGDRDVMYQNLNDMMKARDVMRAEIQAAAGTGRKRTMRMYQSGNGL